MVFDLVVEAAHQPAQRPHPTRDVDGRAQLVQLEIVTASGFVRDGELGGVDAVGELEDHRE